VRWLLALAFGLAHASPPTIIFAPTDHTAQIAVSAGTAVRTNNLGGYWNVARSDTAQSVGVRYVEFQIDNLGGTFGVSVGVASGAAPLNQRVGYDMNGVAYWSGGNTIKNNTWAGVMPPAYVAGDHIGMWVDFGAHTVKFARLPDPPSAPLDITSLGPDVFVAVTLGEAPGAIHVVADSWNDFTEPTINLIGHGDSLSNIAGVQRGYLPRLADLIRSNGKGWARWTRAGINGASWDYAWPQAGYPYTLTQDIAQRVIPALSPNLPNWVIAWAGTNGFALEFHNAATEYAKLQADVNALIAAGVPARQVVVPTMLPRNGVSETTRTAYNALIVGDAGGLGYTVAPFHLDPIYGVAGANTDPLKYPDGVHPVDAAHAIFAQILYALIYP
jgi:lysophospholipase L1-like esterase